MIITQLELRPGSVVVESGTGSGSLTHSLARTVAPHGRVHTFDFHEQRAEAARAEFKRHGLGDVVVSAHADACRDGFGLEDAADAAFLDLPHPWDAVPHAKRAIKRRGGRICSFSPCIEQVQKTCAALRKEGFTEISTLECLLREFQVRRITQQLFDSDRESNEVSQEAAKKRKLEDHDESEDSKKEARKRRDPETSYVTGVPLLQMPGHTGYLTFATLMAKRDEK